MIGSNFSDPEFEKWLNKLGFEQGTSCMFCNVSDTYSIKLTPSVCSTIREIQVTEYINKKPRSRWFDNEQAFMDYFTDIMAVQVVMTS